MTRPQFTASISLGNILTAVGLALALGGSVAVYKGDLSRADQKIEALEGRQGENRDEIKQNTTAIRSLEMSGAAINQRLHSIEMSAQRTERMLERLIEAQE